MGKLRALWSMTVFIGWLLHPFFHILVLAPSPAYLPSSGFQWADLIPSTQRQGTICIIVADSDCFMVYRYLIPCNMICINYSYTSYLVNVPIFFSRRIDADRRRHAKARRHVSLVRIKAGSAKPE